MFLRAPFTVFFASLFVACGGGASSSARSASAEDGRGDGGGDADAMSTLAASADGGLFGCGSETCDGHSQICEHVRGGVPPGVDFYSCIAIPSECAAAVTCACVSNALRGSGAGACSASGGGLTVDIDVP